MFGRGKPDHPTYDVYRPAPGQVMSLDDVDDPVFARRMLGDGFAVDPLSGDFAAPIAGQIIILARSLHAFGLRSPEGLEVLVHIGLDTVDLHGDGFATTHAVGDQVELGEVIITADADDVRAKVRSLVTSVVVTNGDDFQITDLRMGAAPGEPPMTVADVRKHR